MLKKAIITILAIILAVSVVAMAKDDRSKKNEPELTPSAQIAILSTDYNRLIEVRARLKAEYELNDIRIKERAAKIKTLREEVKAAEDAEKAKDEKAPAAEKPKKDDAKKPPAKKAAAETTRPGGPKE